jgi:hypothetical protein
MKNQLASPPSPQGFVATWPIVLGSLMSGQMSYRRSTRSM